MATGMTIARLTFEWSEKPGLPSLELSWNSMGGLRGATTVLWWNHEMGYKRRALIPTVSR